ncbi:MAG: nucleotidyltransferase [Deltaproteobacteria bacterium]|nr:MAG: nucleotidyltransferase [Deltaproteobacteria bacterium]
MQGPRTGVILAAGFGSRLEGVSDETRLKPLTPVAGEPLLLRAIDSLAKAGCARVVVVVGHGGDAVEREVGGAYRGDVDLVFAKNPRFDLANGVSVLAARPYLLGHEFVLTMADHVLGDEVMALAAAHHPGPEAATLLVDAKLDTIFDMDDATKVLAEDGRIVKIGKQIPEYNCVDCGVFVCSVALMDAIKLVFDQRGDASLSDGVQALASAGRMHVLDIGDGFWQDVDTPEMLAHAEQVLSARAARS